MKSLIVWTLALSLSLACGSKSDPLQREEQIRLDELQAEINGLIEEGHEAEPLPVMSQDDLEELEVRMHRRQIADQMRAGVAEAMTPLVFAAALFAPEGAVDLLLTVLPAERIGRAAADIATRAFKARKRSKRARELVRLSDEFHAALTPEARNFMRLADKLEEADLRALRTIYEYTTRRGVRVVRERLPRPAFAAHPGARVRCGPDHDHARRCLTPARFPLLCMARPVAQAPGPLVELHGHGHGQGQADEHQPDRQ